MPIITSQSRKDRHALKQLIEYVIAHDKEQPWSFTLTHNISPRANTEQIITAFKDNDKFRKKRKGGVVLFHDIISFHPKDSHVLRADPSIMEEITRQYITKRSPYGLAFAKVHEDKEHLHVHIILSATEKDSSVSIRLSRKEFRLIRREIEAYQWEKYPELKYSYLHSSIKKERRQKKLLSRDKERTL